MNDRRYVRVYYSVLDDPRFADVYPSDANLAAWLRLLMAADAMYPAPASLPRWLGADVAASLVDVGIVELLPGDLYRIHGLEAERERRAMAGRPGGIASGAARRTNVERKSNAVEPAEHKQSISRAEQEHKNTSPRAAARPPAREDPETTDDPAFDTYCKFVNVASLNASKWIDDLVAQFGERQTADAIATAGLGGPSKLLERAKAALVKGARAADRREAADEKVRLAEKRKPDPLYAEIKAAQIERYGEDRR